MLSARGLSFARGARPILAGVELAVGQGEIVAVVGASGAGKTTLLRLLAGLERPDAGEVSGEPTALMPQGDALLPWRDALANALVAARIEGRDAAASRAEAEALFARFGLAEALHAAPQTLSGGMRRRVALLRTFLAHRPVLLLDEPFGALDAVTRDELAGWLREVLAALPRAVVMVTHDVDEAVALAQRVLVLGGSPAQVQAVIEPAADPGGARTSVLTALRAGGGA